jgi:pimeloyl-ACP methyl ester carboxylesterase
VTKVFYKVIKNFFLLVAAMIFSGCNIQNNFLYFPDSTAPSEETLKAANIKPWPSSLKDYRGFVSMLEQRHTNGTVIVFHGNGGAAVDRTFYVKVLGDLGYRVILAEYPQYGGRKGALGEKSFVNDANETTLLASQQFGGPLFLLGESLGCGVTAAVAHTTSARIDGVILITPWDNLASIAHSKFPFLPVRLLLTDKYDNIGNLESFKGRIIVVGTERDEVIPIKHATALYTSLSSSAKQMWVIREAGHNNWPLYTNRSWWKDIMDFASSNNGQ